jgi:phosphate-selective porin OprO/OprP
MLSFAKKLLGSCVVLGVATGLSWGQSQPPSTSDEVRALKALIQQQQQQMQQQQKQIDALTQRVNTQSVKPAVDADSSVDARTVRSIIADYLRENPEYVGEKAKGDSEKAKADKVKLETEGYRIGSDLRMSATWRDGFVATTPNDDFTFHAGGWMHYDNVWWTQSHALTVPRGANAGKAQGVLSGNSLGGINDLDDGTFFRRIRFMMDGKFWENYEYTLIIAFENDQFNTIGLDEFWVGAMNIPVLGTLRAGHVKAAHGLEADMTGSSRTMTFMERSSYSEAIEGNVNFITGLWLGNAYFDQRATWSASIGRQDVASATGAFFGDGQYMALGRATALPLYECDGRHLMHVGVSGGWFGVQNNIGNPPVVGSALRTVQLRARPELRDDVPAAGFQNGNSNRLVDTGVLAADSQWQLGTEFLYVRGPLSVQAEYGWAFIEGVAGQVVGGKVTVPTVGKGNQSYTFSGGYVQLAYTLTGENRSYDKRLGRLDTYYFGRRGPFTNAWLVRDEDGLLNWGLGAWELAARYSYLDLNDGNDGNRIQGGRMGGLTVGVNWYLNTNLKVQVEWVYNQRFADPVGTISGYTSGLGARVQFMW